MNSLHQQLLYTLVGTLKLSKDKFQELMEELIQNRQYTEDEGRRITLEFYHQMDVLKRDIQEKISFQIEETKSAIQAPIQKKAEEIIKDVKQKIQDYSIQQLLSK